MDRISTDELRETLLTYTPLSVLMADVPARAHLLSNMPKPVTSLNILVLGEAGAGKSSLVSTWYRALHPDDVHREPIAEVGRPSLFQPTSTTRKYRPFGVNAPSRSLAIGEFTPEDAGFGGASSSSTIAVPSATLQAYDCKGLVSTAAFGSSDESEREYITHMQLVLYGLVRPNCEILNGSLRDYTICDLFRFLFTLNRATVLDPSCRPPEEPSIASVPHVVVVVLPANATTISPAMIRMVHTARNMGYQPVIAISKIDCHAGAGNDTFASIALVDDKKSQIIRQLSADHSDVFPLQNYVDFARTDKTCDRLALKILFRAVERGEEYILTKSKNRKERSWCAMQ